MKAVTAIIKPFKLDEVKEGLTGLGITHLTVTEAKGFISGSKNSQLYRGAEYVVDFKPKVKIEVIVQDDKVDVVVQVIMKAARSGNVGDGCVFVTSTEQLWHIRTGANMNDST